MEREVSLDEISDGKLYDLNDMVKADCHDCEGCSACCRGMGTSIVLDPLDTHRLSKNLHLSFEELLCGGLELNLVDGIILPNLKMAAEAGDACAFLNTEGRCSIHAFRPGICRLFPLGRFYEDGAFQYFLQVHECRKDNKTKVKVRKWIDTPDIKNNERFITQWHYFLKEIQTWLKTTGDEALVKSVNMYLLNRFYLTAFDDDSDFYEQFEKRLIDAREFIIERRG